MKTHTRVYEDGRLNTVGTDKKIYGSWNAEFTRARRNLSKDRNMDDQSRAIYAQYFGRA